MSRCRDPCPPPESAQRHPSGGEGHGEGTGTARESDSLADGVTPPKGPSLASEGIPGVREQAEPGGGVSVATRNSSAAGNREATAPGHSPPSLPSAQMNTRGRAQWR